MKRIKLLSLSLAVGAVAAVPLLSQAESGAPAAPAQQVEKPEEAPGPKQWKVTVRLTDKEGEVLSEVVAPAVERAGELDVQVTTLTRERQRRMVSVNAPAKINEPLSIQVWDVDRPAISNGVDGKALAVGGGTTLFRVSSVYKGAGEYEVYRNLWERMTVVLE
ncbi:MAG: hypothetical protein QM755_08890 [Luteolibacter sp.]